MTFYINGEIFNATIDASGVARLTGVLRIGDNNVVQIYGNSSVRVNDTVRAVDTVPAAEVREPVTCTFRIVTVYENTR